MMYTRLKETVVGWVDNVVVFSLLLRSVVVKRWKVIVAGLCVALATLAGFRVWNTRWGTETAVRFLESQVHALEDRLKRYSEPTVTLGLIDMTVTSGAVAAMWFVFIFFFETLPLMLSGGDKALVLGAARSATPRKWSVGELQARLDAGTDGVLDLCGGVVAGPGTLRMTRPGTVVANGSVECRGGVAVEARGCHLEGVAVRGVKGEDSVALDVLAGGFRAVDCTVSGNQGFGVQVSGSDAEARLQRCTVAQNGMHGVYVGEGAQVVVDECTMEGNGDLGVLAMETATVVQIIKGTISENRGTGLRASDGAQVRIVGTAISRNMGPSGNGIMADGRGTVVQMTQGKVTRNNVCGVLATEGAAVALEDIEKLSFNGSYQVWAYGAGTHVDVQGVHAEGSTIAESHAHMVQLGSQREPALRVQDGATLRIAYAILGAPNADAIRVVGTQAVAYVSMCQVVDTAKGVVDRDITREEKFAGDRDAKSAEKITINAPKTPVRMKGKQM